MSPGWTLFMLAATGATAQAQDVGRMYTNSQLKDIGSRYEPNLKGLWQEDFLSRLSPAERALAGNVTLELPLIGMNRRPLDFYAHAGDRQVFVPIASMKFVDDMAIAMAYYEKMGCDAGTVSDYAAALRLRPKELTGTPLDRLGVPATALKDPVVNDIALKILNSVIFFVVAHEYAHVMYQHRGSKEIPAPQSQRQETEADAFALTVLLRIAVPPIALGPFFLITSRIEASPGDFATPEAYEVHLQQHATHPVSAARLAHVAEVIRENVDAYSRLQPDPAATAATLRVMAGQLQEIGRTLDDRRMRRFLNERAWAADVASFRNGCRR